MSFTGYVAWNGPVDELVPAQEGGETVLRMPVLQRHLNFGQRLHGGASMALLSLAQRRACWRALAGREDVKPEFVSMRIDFVGAAGEGAQVEARAEVIRATRSLFFTRALLRGADHEVVASSSAIFKVGSAHGMDEVPACAESPEPPTGFALYDSGESFTRHAGPLYERYDEAGERHGGFLIAPRHLGSDGGVLADEAAAMLLGDLMLGRRAWQAVDNRPCVTLSLDIARLADIRLGDLVQVHPRCEGVDPPVVFVAGDFTVEGRKVMSGTGRWKILGA